MLKSILILPDGRELSSGAEADLPLMSVSLTESVNDHEELTMGAVFANILEAKVYTYENTLDLTAGDEVVLYKEDEKGKRHKAGVFVLEKPTRPTPETMQLRGFDRIIKLNRDLTAWLKGLDGWPYRLVDFAGMVCNVCGLDFVAGDVPNGDFLVQPFAAEATGYQLMRWIGEVCCRFCRANVDGKIELGWYSPAGVSITPSGDSYYLHNSLSYEAYEVAPVEAVQLRLADQESGMLWPQVPEGSNSYIIESNPILLSCVTEELLPVLENIRQTLPGAPYRPFRVSIPATLDIRAGNTVQITDKNGVSFLSLVMSKEQVGQKDTLECTGSPRRDSAAAQHEMTEQEKTLQMQTSAQQYTNDLDRRLDQTGVFDRLTNSGSCQGLFMQDGQLYINASYIKSGIIDAELVQVINLISDKVVSKDQYGGKLEVLGGVLRLYQDDKTLIDMTTEYEGYPLLRMTMLSNGEIATRLEMGAEGIRVVDLTGFVPSVKFAVALDANGEPAITCKDALGQVVEKKLSWKDNTDGTFTLIGK